MNINTTRKATNLEIETLYDSEEYGNFIMEHSHGDRSFCNGNDLFIAMENSYLFDEFLDSIGLFE